MMQTSSSGTIDPRKAVTKRAQSLVAYLATVIYWLVIFEGALRKWILVPLAKPLFFVRDPFLLYLYFISYKAHLLPTKSRLFQLLVVISILFLILSVIQCCLGKVHPLAALYGWRMYFLYVPLGFLAGAAITAKQLRQLTRNTLLISIKNKMEMTTNSWNKRLLVGNR